MSLPLSFGFMIKKRMGGFHSPMKISSNGKLTVVYDFWPTHLNTDNEFAYIIPKLSSFKIDNFTGIDITLDETLVDEVGALQLFIQKGSVNEFELSKPSSTISHWRLLNYIGDNRLSTLRLEALEAKDLNHVKNLIEANHSLKTLIICTEFNSKTLQSML